MMMCITLVPSLEHNFKKMHEHNVGRLWASNHHIHKPKVCIEWLQIDNGRDKSDKSHMYMYVHNCTSKECSYKIVWFLLAYERKAGKNKLNGTLR